VVGKQEGLQWETSKSEVEILIWYARTKKCEKFSPRMPTNNRINFGPISRARELKPFGARFRREEGKQIQHLKAARSTPRRNRRVLELLKLGIWTCFGVRSSEFGFRSSGGERMFASPDAGRIPPECL